MKFLNTSVLSTLFIILSADGFCCCPTQSEVSPHAAQYRSKYVNPDYRFSVALPSGLIGFGSSAPDPNHGFVVFLPKSSDSCLSVHVFYVNPDDSAKRHQFIAEHGPLPEGQALDHLETSRIASRTRESCLGRQVNKVRETLVAIANDGLMNGFPVEEMEYRIELDTDEREYARGQVLLKQVAESFRHFAKNKTAQVFR
jgi:hypothetical protein